MCACMHLVSMERTGRASWPVTWRRKTDDETRGVQLVRSCAAEFLLLSFVLLPCSVVVGTQVNPVRVAGFVLNPHARSALSYCRSEVWLVRELVNFRCGTICLEEDRTPSLIVQKSGHRFVRTGFVRY
jgi:hypothetical protein